MSSELKPCPFCGNDGTGPIEEALHVCMMEHDWRVPSWSVQCDKCTATMGYSDSEEEAVEAWNSRASHAENEALRSALRAAIDYFSNNVREGDPIPHWLGRAVNALEALKQTTPTGERMDE